MEIGCAIPIEMAEEFFLKGRHHDKMPSNTHFYLSRRDTDGEVKRVGVIVAATCMQACTA